MTRTINPPRGETTHALTGRITVTDRRPAGTGLDKAGHPTVPLHRYDVLLDGQPVGSVEQVQRDAYRRDRYGQRHRSGRGMVTIWLLATTDGVEHSDYADRSLAITLYDSLSAHLGLPV